MRIAFLCYRGSMQSGGQGIYLASLTRALAARGLEIDVFVGPPYPDPMPWARVFQIENQRFWGARFQRDPAAFLPRPDPLRMFRPLNFYAYALAHDVQSLGYGLLWLQATGLPVVSTVHHPLSIDRASSLRRDRSFAELKGTLTFYPVRTQSRVARHLAGIITSSEASAARIERDFGVPRARIQNVGNGVDLPMPQAPRKRPERTELLFVGRAGDPNKGLEYLLFALALLPQDVTLRVLDDYPAETPLDTRIQKLRLGQRVTFEGKVSRGRLEEALVQASVVVLPSLFEGFGLPAIEALASGTPVVATRAGALPEILARAGTGRLVSPADPPALAKAIGETLESWEASQREAISARPRIEREFDWGQIAARVEAIYERLGREHPRVRA